MDDLEVVRVLEALAHLYQQRNRFRGRERPTTYAPRR